MTVLAWALIGYACGSLPSAWLVALASGHRAVLADVRRTSGEHDAHLVLKGVASRAASVAAAADVIKGLVPVAAAVFIAGPYGIAACALGAVTGHCWPPILSRYAGRGLATTAGTFLGMLPFEMVIAGIVRVIGSLLKIGGLSSTIGFWAVPAIAWLRDQPRVYVLASLIVNVLISLRRLEGIEDDVGRGAPLAKAVFRRVVFDASTHADRFVL